MLPVKKRFSMPEVSADSLETPPRPSKKSNMCSDGELELLRLKRDLEFQRMQAAARFIPLRHSPSSSTAPLGQVASVISPETMAVPFPYCEHAAPPFKYRRVTDGIEDLTTIKKSTTSPLDLLSSVSTIVAGRRNSCPETSSVTTTGNVAARTSRAQPILPQEEKYLGQRHPLTGLRHGKGIMRYRNGCRYVGYFVNDCRHGYGKCWYANGCVYSGYWKDNMRHGVGTMTYVNGDVFEGSWENDQRLDSRCLSVEGREVIDVD